ncbi:uncharacterized protein LOC129768686 [Toxorhynchites rutilus septentrionalis]|uniref:uncharacterized protein LOC129768686 n=1 Tax=Toxorhynchites rutilus septentrionalis TaxID=329112 RepID=UPI0024787F8F|nr:uncharacterized protein LOC129768686 [Toxorhynchites rutilus septentrionalis]
MANHSGTCICIILIYCVLWVTCSFSCDSCGRECTSACGTRHFRTCCFNYLRKRSPVPPIAPPPPSSQNAPHGFDLNAWLAKSRLDQAEHHRGFSQPSNDLDLLLQNRNIPREMIDNDIDYDPQDGTHGLNRVETENSKRNLVVASHSRHFGKYRRQKMADDQDAEQKASENSEPGRLQLLYDA